MCPIPRWGRWTLSRKLYVQPRTADLPFPLSGTLLSAKHHISALSFTDLPSPTTLFRTTLFAIVKCIRIDAYLAHLQITTHENKHPHLRNGCNIYWNIATG
jgi:hypothetical protein